MRRIFASCLMILLVCSLGLFAQERTGNIAGTVSDAHGAVVPGASVTIKNAATQRTLTTKSRPDGSYNFADIEPGRYSVVFAKDGFGKQEVPDVLVLLGKTANVTVALKVGGVSETVEVTSTAQAIDLTSSSVTASIPAEEFDSLPKARRFEQAAVLATSVNTGFAEGGLQINGASAAENAYYIDGVATNSVVDGSARQSSTFDYLQEVQVKTTGLDAEYGGALGGVVSAVTKSGGNAFHGEAHYYYYGNKLSAGPAKRLAINRSAAAGTTPAVGYIQDGKFKNDTHDFGGSIGGPIMKDSLWFYTSFAPSFNRRNQYFAASDGNTNLKRASENMSWFSKLSWNPTDRIRTNFSYLYTPQYLTGSFPAYNTLGVNTTTQSLATLAANNKLGYAQAENSVSGQVDVTVTNKSVLTVKGGRYYLNYKDKGVENSRQWIWGTTIPETVPNVGNFDVSRSAQSTTPTAATTAHDLTTRTYVQADFSQLFSLLGSHNLKVGLGTFKNVNNVLDASTGPQGNITLYWNDSCATCLTAGGTARGTNGYYTVDLMGTVGSAGSNIVNVYGQDSWQITKRLTVNAGVRLEKETIPSFAPEVQKYAFQFGFSDKISPRLGASFDLFGNGKVKISGGWGRYFDWTKYDLARGTFGADTWVTYYRALDDPNIIPTISINNMPGTNLFPSAFKNWRTPGFEYLDPNVKPMSSDSMNFGVEWEVKKNLVFTGRYVRAKLNRTIEDLGVIIDGSEQYFYGNPGEGQNAFGPSCYQTQVINGKTTLVPTCEVAMPKAKRVYDALELSLSRRFSAGYMFNVSYVYSKLYGNYSGIANTDEILSSAYGSTYGGNQAFFGQNTRPGGNASRAWDVDQAYFDANGNTGVFGRLPTDRPHVVKFYGSKSFKFGTEVGTFFRVMSGTPVSTQAWTSDSVGMYVNGRGDLGRTPILSQTDLVVAHSFKVGEGKSIRVEMNVLNLFNQKTALYEYNFYNRRENRASTGMIMKNVDLRDGFDYKALVSAAGAQYGAGGDLDPRYGKQSDFNQGFQGRFMIKYSF